ncbi:MAG: plasmid mobilization protein [Pilosibacter sp.]
MENRKRNVHIIVRVTEDERTLIEEKMRQIPTMNLSAYSRKMLIDRYIIVLERNLRRRKDSLHKRNGALRNWTGYSNAYLRR